MTNLNDLKWWGLLVKSRPIVALVVGQTAVIVFITWYSSGEIKDQKAQVRQCNEDRTKERDINQRLMDEKIKDLRSEKDTLRAELRELREQLKKKR